MEVDHLPGVLHPQAQNAHKRNERHIFYQVQDVKSQSVSSRVGEQILVWKDSVSVKEAPEKQQKKKVRKHPMQPGGGFMRSRKDYRCRHERYQVQEQYRVSDRIVGTL